MHCPSGIKTVVKKYTGLILSLTTPEKQTIKFITANFKNMFHYFRANGVDPY